LIFTYDAHYLTIVNYV